MHFTPAQIETIAPNPNAFKAGNKLSAPAKWTEYGHSQRAIWGIIKGSGKKPYYTEIDLQDVAYKCSCPSRQFPCKHSVALMLLFAGLSNKEQSDEPDWVTEWIDKRRKKAEPKEEKIRTPEEEKKSAKAKEKRQENRSKLVDAGIQELNLWLSDLIRAGLLELPNKPPKYYNTIAARMVDAQASGLAGLIKSLGQINFSSTDEWLEEATSIIGKLNLLMQSWKNINNLPEDWQISVKNLIGWSQSPKDLLTDKQATAIKDHWIVLGQEKEDLFELVILRTWLWGIKSGKSALVINFSTQFAPLENTMIVGSILDAEFAFFPGNAPQRGIIRNNTKLLNSLPKNPSFHNNFVALIDELHKKELDNPWLDNEVFLVENIRLIKQGKNWFLLDADDHLIPTIDEFNDLSNMKWILKTGNKPVNISMVVKENKALPLGIFSLDNYEAL